MIKKIKSFLFENKHASQTVAKNTFWLGIGTFSSRVVKAIIIIYAARVLGTTDYGIFSYSLSLAALFSIFADVGMGPILTREVAKDPKTLEKNLATSLVIKLILVGISVILVAFISPFFSTIKGVNNLMILAALLVAFDALREFGFSITRAKEKMETEAAINLTTSIAVTLFGFGALALKKSALSLMTGYMIGSGIGFILSFILLRGYLRNLWCLFDASRALHILKEATPFAVMGLLGAITTNTDAVMIGWLNGADDVGRYSVAIRIVGLAYLIPTMIATSVFPLISRLAKKEDARVSQIMERIVPFSLSLAIPIFVGGAILASPILLFLFGSDYVSAGPAFALLLFTIILSFPGAIIINSIFAYNEQKTLITALTLGALGNALLDYLLIPKMGISGSSIATVVSQGVAFLIIWGAMKHINNFKTVKYMWKSLVAGLIMGVVTIVLNALGIHVILNVIASGMIYILTLTALKDDVFRQIITVFKMRKETAL
ncbi:MAG: flippase [bacterium]